MPIIKVDEADQFEDKPVPEGTYSLRIVKAEKKRNKKGTRDMIVVTLKIQGTEGADAALINEWLTIPEDDDEHYRMMMRNISRFALLFGLESFDTDNPDDIANLEGLEAECYLVLEARKDADGKETGEESNRLRLPRAGK